MILGGQYELTCCRTAAEGLASMRRNRPDLLLLDIMLTYPSEGLQVACQMRQDPQLCDIPIVFLSAIGQSAGVDYAKEVCPVELDVDMFIEKPLDASVVRRAVESVLQKRYGGAPAGS